MEIYRPKACIEPLEVTTKPKTSAEKEFLRCLSNYCEERDSSFFPSLHFHLAEYRQSELYDYIDTTAIGIFDFAADVYFKNSKIILVVIDNYQKLEKVLEKKVPVAISKLNTIEIIPDSEHTTGKLDVLKNEDRQLAINVLADIFTVSQRLV